MMCKVTGLVYMYMVSSRLLTLVGAFHLRICQPDLGNWCMNGTLPVEVLSESLRENPFPVRVMRETKEATKFLMPLKKS